ncbi:response regulator transcription factor [bacterium SCSIO 12741]|nr:response regulator transcription factor [bacterium SCSIO 12741]
MKIKTVIIEDEPRSLKELRSQLDGFRNRIEVLGHADNVEDGVRLITELQPQLVFLDVEINQGTGFDLLQQLDTIDFKVVFTTAHSKYALRAIKFGALDYLLKPIDPEELEALVGSLPEEDSINSELNQLKVMLNHLTEQQTPKKLAIKEVGKVEFINLDKIILLKAKTNYTQIQVAGRKPILSSKTLRYYEQLLTDKRFRRVHRSFIINYRYVREFVHQDHLIVMENGEEVYISPNQRKDFLDEISL